MLHILYLCGDRGLDLTKTEGYRVHVAKIIENLRLIGQKVFLLAVNDKTKLPGFSGYHCVPHRYAPIVHHFFPYTGTIDSISIFMEILQLHRHKRFDIIHERFGLYSCGGVLASRFLDIPYVVEVNGPGIEEKEMFTEPIEGWQRKAALYCRKLCLINADKVIAVSNILKDFLIRECGVAGKKIVVAPNATDLSAFDSASKSSILELEKGTCAETAFCIGYVGTLQVWYGLETLINAMPFVLKEAPQARLIFVGDGQARPSLERKVKEDGLTKKVIFLGNKSHEEIPQVLKTLDVATAPYIDIPAGFFNSPIKIFEYLAAGKAIVASDIGQISEIIENGRTGLLVRPGNPQQLANAIIKIARDPTLRKQLESAARLSGKQYTWENYAKKLVDIYKGVKELGS